MPSSQPERFHSIPSATGGIARLACARLREFGRDATVVITEVGARPESFDDAIRLVTMVRICRQATDTRLALRRFRIRYRATKRPRSSRVFLAATLNLVQIAMRSFFRHRWHPSHCWPRQLFERSVAAIRRGGTRRPSERARALRSAVERTLPQLLPHARASLSNVAKQLAISTRTLSRKLREEGVAFTTILDETRAALAKGYLAERVCRCPRLHGCWDIARLALSSTRSTVGPA